MKAIAITTLKNEGAYLLEWLAHHRAVGFSDFLVFSNDCDDGTDLMLDHLQGLGWLTHVRNPGPWTQGPQWAALHMADRHPAVKAADWAMVLDVDEFVNIHAGARTLAALIATAPDIDAWPMTWRLFGNAGQIAFQDTLITRTFTRAAPRVLHWPWRALMVKTLFRPAAFGKLGVHRPKGGAQARWSDPDLGQRLFSTPGRDPYALVQLNHYALGSMESYLVKADRGRANREAGAFDMAYWCDRNFDAEDDTSITRMDSAAPLAALHADPILGALHQNAVAWRHARFATLMQEEPWRALFGRLLMTPPARVLGRDEAAMIRRHRLA